MKSVENEFFCKECDGYYSVETCSECGTDDHTVELEYKKQTVSEKRLSEWINMFPCMEKQDWTFSLACSRIGGASGGQYRALKFCLHMFNDSNPLNFRWCVGGWDDLNLNAALKVIGDIQRKGFV